MIRWAGKGSRESIFTWKQAQTSPPYRFELLSVSHFHSSLQLHFTRRHPRVFVLPTLLIPHPERAIAALPRGCFHEGVGREGLACRYEQSVTTDGSSLATLPPPLATRLEASTFRSKAALLVQFLVETARVRGPCDGCFTGCFIRANWPLSSSTILEATAHHEMWNTGIHRNILMLLATFKSIAHAQSYEKCF